MTPMGGQRTRARLIKRRVRGRGTRYIVITNK